MKTVYHVFDRLDQAERAMTALAVAGLPADRIALLSRGPVDDTMFPSTFRASVRPRQTRACASC